jgi:ABC-type transporter Mla maintaining outer membrane lipid asymmetry ATPase subunit MlaF
MSTESTSSGYTSDVVVDLKQVVMTQVPPYDVGLDGVSLTINRGE